MIREGSETVLPAHRSDGRSLSAPVSLDRVALLAIATVIALVILHEWDPFGASRAGERNRLRELEDLVAGEAWTLAAQRGSALLERHYTEPRVHWLMSQVQRGNGLPDFGLQHLVIAAMPREGGAPPLFPEPTRDALRREVEAYDAALADGRIRRERLLRLVRVQAALGAWDAVGDAMAPMAEGGGTASAAETAFAAALLGLTPEAWRDRGAPAVWAASLCSGGGARVVPAESMGVGGLEIGVLAGGVATGGRSLFAVGEGVRPAPAGTAWQLIAIDPASGAVVKEGAVDLSGPSGHAELLDDWLRGLPEPALIAGAASDAATASAPADARQALRAALAVEGIPSRRGRRAFAFVAMRSGSTARATQAAALGADWPAMLLCRPERDP